MKNFTTVLLLLVVALTVTVDAGRNRKHRSDVRKDEDVENNGNIADWPSPDQVHHFEVPEEFIHGASHDEAAEEHDRSSGNNHKKSSTHGKNHRHE